MARTFKRKDTICRIEAESSTAIIRAIAHLLYSSVSINLARGVAAFPRCGRHQLTPQRAHATAIELPLFGSLFGHQQQL